MVGPALPRSCVHAHRTHRSASPPTAPGTSPSQRRRTLPTIWSTPVRRPSQRASWMHSLLRTQLRTARSPLSAWGRSTVSMETGSGCLVMGAWSPPILSPHPGPLGTPPSPNLPSVRMQATLGGCPLFPAPLTPQVSASSAAGSPCSGSEASRVPRGPLCLPLDGGCSPRLSTEGPDTRGSLGHGTDAPPEFTE